MTHDIFEVTLYAERINDPVELFMWCLNLDGFLGSTCTSKYDDGNIEDIYSYMFSNAQSASWFAIRWN